MKTALLVVMVCAGLSAARAWADEVTYQFRSVEDPAFPPDDSVCAQAPFRVNVKLGASLWSQHTRAVDGRVVLPKVLRVGRATACVELTNFLFPPGLAQNFYVVFDLPSGRYTAVGTCTLTSNDVPTAGLVLAGCALDVVAGPQGVVGGVATSASTFNPARLAGYSTGSSWTLQAYTSAPVGWWPWPGSTGWAFHDDTRTEAALAAARARLGGRHVR
ncbi:MAG: hypothetical protein JNJ54_15415 [Myxococcaceae bacterium]|nr:hypothetical protein [Myxococcaceae bacterium]